MTFADIIKELRTDRGLSQQQLADELKISQSAIAKWELSKTEPVASMIVKLAKYFDVDSDFLLGLRDENGNPVDWRRLFELPKLLQRALLIKCLDYVSPIAFRNVRLRMRRLFYVWISIEYYQLLSIILTHFDINKHFDCFFWLFKVSYIFLCKAEFVHRFWKFFYFFAVDIR